MKPKFDVTLRDRLGMVRIYHRVSGALTPTEAAKRFKGAYPGNAEVQSAKLTVEIPKHIQIDTIEV